MTNHVHLLLTPEESGAPSRLMQSLGRRYVQYASRFHRRTGSLWEGRYESSVVQAEDYLMACQRHIELNPVRAGMVADPGQYQWSSYRANGLVQTDTRPTRHALYLALGKAALERGQAYRALFRPELDTEAAADIGQALRLGMPVGNGRFAETLCDRLGIQVNSGKRGRPVAKESSAPGPVAEQQDFGS